MTGVTTVNSTAEEIKHETQNDWRDLVQNSELLIKRIELFRLDEAAIYDLQSQVDISLRGWDYQHSTRDFNDDLPFGESENATNIVPHEVRINTLVESLLKADVDTVSSDSEIDHYIFELEMLVRLHGSLALNVIYEILANEELEQELAWITLQELGRLDDFVTHDYRFWILTRGLKARSHWYRDGSALGLSLLLDPAALPYLIQAKREELHVELKQSYSKIIGQLEPMLL